MVGWKKKIKEKITNFDVELENVLQNCNIKGSDVEILYATKYLNQEKFELFIQTMVEMSNGHVLIGENRVQDANEKFEYLKYKNPQNFSKIKKVLIGDLQKNKVNKAIEIFDAIHSVDSFNLALLLEQKLKKKQKKMEIFLEVNVSGEATKHGLNLKDSPFLIEKILNFEYIELKGLMTMAPNTVDKESIRLVFRGLKDLAGKYNLQTSMGMSSDWQIAVEEGSDIIRIGSKIFNDY